MKLYRIYTENKNKERIKQLLSASFTGWTMFEGIGAWKGKEENSLLIEIYFDNEMVHSLGIFYALIEDIKRENQQESVLLTITDCQTKFI